MKVLHLSKFFAPVRGGIETVVWELVEGLNRLGVNTDVICSNHEKWATSNEVSSSGYRITRLGSLGIVQATSIAPSMPSELIKRRRDYDVIHVHMPDPMAAISLRLSGSSAPLVVHWHSDVIRQRIALKLYRPLQDWVLRRADAIICTSEAYAVSSKCLQRFRDKVQVIPIGISDDRPLACSLKAASIRQEFEGKSIIFSLGRMTYYKGFEVLIDAAQLLPNNCVVLVGGDGEQLALHRQQVRAKRLEDKIHFLGPIPDHELPSYFQACDVFCLPSTVRAEAYGVAMLEAMVMGKPIVATDISGSGVPMVNLHGTTGYNVPVRDSAALSTVLSKLVSDRESALRMGMQSRARYEEFFTAALMISRTATLYGAIAARHGISHHALSLHADARNYAGTPHTQRESI